MTTATASASGCCNRADPVSSDAVRIAADIRALLVARAAEASICPSEVARHLYAEDAWRSAMPDVRCAAIVLAKRGVITITQSDHALDPDALISGPIRLRRGPRWNEGGSSD